MAIKILADYRKDVSIELLRPIKRRGKRTETLEFHDVMPGEKGGFYCIACGPEHVGKRHCEKIPLCNIASVIESRAEALSE